MSQELLQHVSKASMKQKRPVLEPGSTVRVHQRVREGNKERSQIFEGLVIKISAGHGPSKTFTVRKVVEGIGVERVFPFYSPNVVKVELVKKGKVRRAKLYYMRDRSGKSARLREQDVKDLGEMPVIEEEVESTPETSVETEEAPMENEAEVPVSSEETPQNEEAPAPEDSNSEEAKNA